VNNRILVVVLRSCGQKRATAKEFSSLIDERHGINQGGVPADTQDREMAETVRTAPTHFATS
jgi:hypothetical protein